MIVNFYDLEEQPVYYTVTAEKCAFFQHKDINTEVGFLPVSTIYEIVDFIYDDDDMDWVKIQMVDGEYFAILTPEKCTIEEMPVIKEEKQTSGIIKQIKSMFKKIFKK